jgi:hypothetical protein
MKKKIFYFIAAALLSSTSAFAQGLIEAQNGDVNRDGVVDVADVTSVIDIMKTGGGVTEVGSDCTCKWTLTNDGTGTWTISDGTQSVVIPLVPGWVNNTSVYYTVYGQFEITNGIDKVSIPNGYADVSIDATNGVATVSSSDGMNSIKLQNTQPVVYKDIEGNVAIQNYDLNGTPVGESMTFSGGGKDGITPHIGANGNWFIGDTDTGVHAQGPMGPRGVDGVNGSSGDLDENGVYIIYKDYNSFYGEEKKAYIPEFVFDVDGSTTVNVGGSSYKLVSQSQLDNLSNLIQNLTNRVAELERKLNNNE